MPVKVVPPVLVPQKTLSMQDIGPITVMSGFMTKKTRSLNKWKQRWWQLMDNGFLFYFKDDNHMKILGQIDIARTCYDVRLGSEKCRVSFPRAAPSCCCISFAVLKRTYHVYTPTAYEAEKWYQALSSMSRIINMKIVAGVERRQAPEPPYPSRPPSCPPNHQVRVTRVQTQQRGSCEDITKIEFVRNSSISSNLSSFSRSGMAQSVPDYLNKIEDDSISLREGMGLDSRLWLDGSPPANSHVHPQDPSLPATKTSWTNSSDADRLIPQSPAQDSMENQIHINEEPLQDFMESQLQGVEEPHYSSTEGQFQATEEPFPKNQSQDTEESLQTSTENQSKDQEPPQASMENQSEDNDELLQALIENQSEDIAELLQTLTENQFNDKEEPLQSLTENQFDDKEEPLQSLTENHSEDTKETSTENRDCHQSQDAWEDEPFQASQENPESQAVDLGEPVPPPSVENHKSGPQSTEQRNNENEPEATEKLQQPSRLSDSVADLSAPYRPIPLARTKVLSKSTHCLASKSEPLAKPVPKPRRAKPQMKRATTEVQVVAPKCSELVSVAEVPATVSPKGTGNDSDSTTVIRRKARTMSSGSSRPSLRQRNNSMPSGKLPRKLQQQQDPVMRQKKGNRSHKRTRSRRLSPPSSPPPPPCPVQDLNAPLLLPLLPPSSTPSSHPRKDSGPPSFKPTLPWPASYQDSGPPDFVPSPPPADDNTVSTMV